MEVYKAVTKQEQDDLRAQFILKAQSKITAIPTTRDQQKLLINILDMPFSKLKYDTAETLLRLNFEISYRYGKKDDFFMISDLHKIGLLGYLKSWIKSYLVGYISTKENEKILSELKGFENVLKEEVDKIDMMKKHILELRLFE